MTKLPLPAFRPDYNNPTVSYFTEAQMLQFRRDALEEAANEAERMTMYPGGRQEAPAHETVWHAARAIRKLKETT